MQEPLVTIITVTYNSSSYVRDTIESVLAQQYSHIQYIIADDCSRDETWQIIQEYGDKRIIAFRNETNLGEYANRNKALSVASGKYLIFIDGDDIIYPHGIGFFVDMMEQFPEAALAVQKGYLNNVLYPALLYPAEAVANFFLGKENLLSSAFVSDFYRTEPLRKSGPLKTKYIGGDNEIRLRIAALHPVLLVAGWVSWSRETPGQASAKIGLTTHLSENYDLIDELDSINNPQLISSEVLAEIRKNGKRIIARYVLKCLSAGRFSAANALLKQTGVSWKEVRTFWNYSSTYKDFLEDYSPVKPFTRGFKKVE